MHWDGKLLLTLTGNERVDRLAILVSGKDTPTPAETSQLLGVPAVARSSGESQAAAVSAVLSEWKLDKRVVGLDFDTTAANTGRLNGACTLIERKLGRQLLYFACRHHILEIVIGDVFRHCFGTSSGPQVALFKRFQASWSRMNQNAFSAGYSDSAAKQALKAASHSVIATQQFVASLLERNDQPRDDYKEFLELVAIFLGGTPARGIRFRAPGATSEATTTKSSTR